MAAMNARVICIGCGSLRSGGAADVYRILDSQDYECYASNARKAKSSKPVRVAEESLPEHAGGSHKFTVSFIAVPPRHLASTRTLILKTSLRAP